MPEQITTTTKTGYGTRIVKSIQGIVVGLLLFIVSFGVLYWNEGRTDMSKIADDAIAISSDALNTDANLNSRLVSTGGVLKTAETLSDGQYLQAGNFLSIHRTVEMYAWQEKTQTESKTNLGGSETTTTTYTYEKTWTTMPADSSDFQEPAGHENPSLTVDSQTYKAGVGTIGVYQVNIRELQLPGSEDLVLTPANTTLSGNAKITDGGAYIYLPAAKPAAAEPAATLDIFGASDSAAVETVETSTQSPQIGDVRIKYSVVNSDITVTVLGQLDGNKISPYYDKTDKLYRAFTGTADGAIATLSQEHKTSTWIWRVIGFLMMWIGLVSILGPISTILDVIPMFGSVSRGLMSLIAFIAALALSIVTIIISAIIHNIWALIIIVGALVGGGYYWYKKKKSSGSAAKPANVDTKQS